MHQQDLCPHIISKLLNPRSSYAEGIARSPNKVVAATEFIVMNQRFTIRIQTSTCGDVKLARTQDGAFS
jgi:hypothetical protein